MEKIKISDVVARLAEFARFGVGLLNTGLIFDGKKDWIHIKIFTI